MAKDCFINDLDPTGQRIRSQWIPRGFLLIVPNMIDLDILDRVDSRYQGSGPESGGFEGS